MKIYLILNEDFYHSIFAAGFLEKTKDEIVGAALVTKVKRKNNVELYLERHLFYLRPFEIIKLAFKKISTTLKDLIHKNGNKSFYSVRSILKFYNIDYIEVKYDINKKIYLDKIKSKKPDVIVSSNPLIFKDELLKIPKICCLNRHSALLPSYRGLLPVFQAIRNGDKYTGVSVHTMERKIDRGIVLAQKKIEITKTDTIDKLYNKCFKISVDVLLEALEKVKKHNFSDCSHNKHPSYFSWPTRKHWQEFRKRGIRFI